MGLGYTGRAMTRSRKCGIEGPDMPRTKRVPKQGIKETLPMGPSLAIPHPPPSSNDNKVTEVPGETGRLVTCHKNLEALMKESLDS